MYKIFFITILVTFLSASNPKPFAILGDIIYNNVETIKALKRLDSYKPYCDDIDKYLAKVAETKVLGYQIEQGKVKESKKEYLKCLRKLSRTNDYFNRTIKNRYKNAMQEKDFTLFSTIINGHYIDTNKNKLEIIDYYFKHKKDINSSGVIDLLLVEDAALKARKKAQRKRYKTKKQCEAEKIKRIRENDKTNKEHIEKKLEKELEMKKLKIREEQIKELVN